MNLINFIKNLDPNLIAIIVAIIGLIGTFTVFFLNRRFGKKDTKNQEFIKAVTEFKAAFTDEIRLLNEPPPKRSYEDTFAILKNAKVKHTNAMIRFKAHVSESERDSFDAAWIQYVYGKDGKEEPEFAYAQYAGSDEAAIRELALDNINRLFGFTKH